jgi:hypothetical protein
MGLLTFELLALRIVVSLHEYAKKQDYGKLFCRKSLIAVIMLHLIFLATIIYAVAFYCFDVGVVLK